MGDRAMVALNFDNIENRHLLVHTHWGGFKIFSNVKDILKKNKNKWDDDVYLSRIIVSQLINNQADGGEGWSLAYSPNTDLEYPILVVDCVKKLVVWSNSKTNKIFEYSFKNFSALTDEEIENIDFKDYGDNVINSYNNVVNYLKEYST